MVKLYASNASKYSKHTADSAQITLKYNHLNQSVGGLKKNLLRRICPSMRSVP